MKTGQFLRLATRYLRPHVRREMEMFVYMLFGLAFTVVFPFAFKQLLDKAIPSGQFSQVLDILAVLLAAFVVSLLAGLRGAYLSAYVSASVVRQLRREMFTKMQTCPRPGTTSTSRATCCRGCSPTSECSSRACRRRCAAGCRRSSRWWCRPSSS